MTAKDSSPSYKVICLENPLLDIQGEGDEAMLQKYGIKADDAILAEEKHMGIFEDLLQNHNAKLIAGGAAQNTARGAQYILPSNSVLYLGCVGSDSYADTLRSVNTTAGLSTKYLVSPSGNPTGRCGVVITGHNRSMVTHLAAANDYQLSHLQSQEVWSCVEKAEFFFVGGYHLTVCPEAAMTLGKEAAEKGKVLMLSLSAPFVPQFFKKQLDDTAPYWDYLVGNVAEFRSYAASHEFPDPETMDVGEIAKKIATLPKANGKRQRVVIVTQGTEETVVAVQSDEAKGSALVMRFPVRGVAKEEIVDTTGAGDAFAGGFLAGVVQSKAVNECVDMGHWLAGLSIRELGPSFPYPPQQFQKS